MISIPVSVGELVDKITILKIKRYQIKDADKLVNIHKEHDALTSLNEYVTIQKDVLEHQQQLMEVNLRLWFLEEDIRHYEKTNFFESAFIDVARRYIKQTMNEAESKKK